MGYNFWKIFRVTELFKRKNKNYVLFFINTQGQ